MDEEEFKEKYQYEFYDRLNNRIAEEERNRAERRKSGNIHSLSEAEIDEIEEELLGL